MLILGIETTGFKCSVALSDNGEVIELASEARLNHLKELTPLIHNLLNKRGVSLRDVDAIAVSVGPGSFTGIRIGISTVRAISQVLGTKCIAVDSMSAMALSMKREFLEANENFDEEEILFCTLVDARQNQVYTRMLMGQDYGETKVVDIEEAVEILNSYENKISNLVLCGDGLDKYSEKFHSLLSSFENKKINIHILNTNQNAKSIVQIGNIMAGEGKFISYDQLLPNYMRKPEAQRRLEDRLK